jgi:chromosome segregation ATPase
MQIEAQRDDLLSQQSHWQDLRRTADHVEMLTKLFHNNEQKDTQELQRYRDRTNVLEGELSTLQKLHSDQEFKLDNMQRASITFKQSIANAQQRAAEWEKKAKEHEHELETCRFKLQQNEEVQVATVAELESYKRQVEEHDGIERGSKARRFIGLFYAVSHL